MNDLERLADILAEAERNRTAVGPVSELVPGGVGMDLAHAICERNIARRIEAGDPIVGFKVGFTNLAARERMGLPDSTYGYLLQRMVLQSGGELCMDDLVAPRIETEICFRLAQRLTGRNLTIDHVLDATDAVSASFEICDSRIRDWKCPYPDSLADNGFAARVVLPGRWIPVCEVDLLGELVVLLRDGRPIAEGRGAMALGHPANAVAWLAGKLSERGRSLEAGTIVMTGTLTPIIPILRGANYLGSFSTLGSVEKTFR